MELITEDVKEPENYDVNFIHEVTKLLRNISSLPLIYVQRRRLLNTLENSRNRGVFDVANCPIPFQWPAAQFAGCSVMIRYEIIDWSF